MAALSQGFGVWGLGNWTETDYRLFAVDELVLMELAPDARLP